ncbi:MAG: VCBS repeat-containing protein [Planctomycetes bacterium]|nr:VCBS repeat-containing protein [Planctomycetota bacterium]
MKQLPLLLLVVVLALGLGWYFGSRGGPAPGDAGNAEGRPEPRDALEALALQSATTDDPRKLFEGEERPRRVFRHPVLAFEPREKGLPRSGTWIGYPLLHDFNGDGRADLVASNREEDGYSAWEAGADGTWILRIEGPPQQDGAGLGLPRDLQYGPAVAADMNGDGIDDLVLSAHTDALRIYLNDGQMRWTRSSGKIDNAFLFLDVATGNLNGDAHVDVAAIAHFEGGAVLYLGDGQGGLRRLPESAAILPQRSMGKDIELADLDGDGIDDLVIASNQGLKAILVRPDPAGGPTRFEDVSAGLPVPTIGNTIYTVAVGRFVPGAWPQIAAAIIANPLDKPEQRDYLGVWAYDVERATWAHADTGLPRDEAYRDVVAADFDRDGDLDLLTISIESGAVIHLNDGRGHFTAKGRLEGSYNKGRAAVGDVDGDGWIDVVVAVPATKEDVTLGSVRCYRNRPEIWQAK